VLQFAVAPAENPADTDKDQSQKDGDEERACDCGHFLCWGLREFR